MPFEPQLERKLSASHLRLRSRAPFFAALALFAQNLPTNITPTAATDGRDVFWYPPFLESLSPAETDGVLLHEVLHAALLHLPRRGGREPLLWNVAADIVINGMIDALPGFALPLGALRDDTLKLFSVEEVYDLLERSQSCPPLSQPDLLGGGEGGGEGDSGHGRDALDAYWRLARTQAEALARAMPAGTLPAGLAREMGILEPASLDWRTTLWRYLARTPTDFGSFDRRFFGRGLYLETLDSLSLQVFLAVDTSGSVSDPQMAQFGAEVQGILRAYPHLGCDLYYADAALHGPFALTDPLPTPVGGGGTDFRPFFDVVRETASPFGEGVCVYLTDGYGTFPEEPPPLPVLWVVTAGGLDLAAFPFGEAVRLILG